MYFYTYYTRIQNIVISDENTMLFVDGVKTIGRIDSIGSLDSSNDEEEEEVDNQINEAWQKTMDMILPSELDALQNSFQ